MERSGVFKFTNLQRTSKGLPIHFDLLVTSLYSISRRNYPGYIRQLITANSTSKEQEIKRRITIGWQAFGRASTISKNKDISLILKRQVYNQCILPTVTYGAETWNLTKKEMLKLRIMQRAHERIMLNITWRDRKTAE
ncbi:uncharacterized protein LOC122249230 [Penaeus japonicus]|uniref:uncharacterized protein LOC122249230 n=1 Tax=Penaeus japonicus TaxID=27405 RepID=UPI001C716563|nr:uncharacterized protein LOC122249230 [Penaeus japonicus]